MDRYIYTSAIKIQKTFNRVCSNCGHQWAAVYEARGKTNPLGTYSRESALNEARSDMDIKAKNYNNNKNLMGYSLDFPTYYI